jgi:outer membrane receptor protein involved in Fe transport
MAQLRVGLAPLGPVPDTEGDFRTGDRPLRLLLNGSYLYTPMPTARTESLVSIRETLRVHQAGVHASAYWAGAYLAGELLFRHADRHSTDPAAAQRTRNWAGYVQASYTFRRVWLGLAARYGYTEPVPYYRGMLLQPAVDWSSTMPGGSTAAGSAHEAAFALVWHPFRPYLRIGLEYQWHRELGYPTENPDRTGQRQAHLANLWAQLRF